MCRPRPRSEARPEDSRRDPPSHKPSPMPRPSLSRSALSSGSAAECQATRSKRVLDVPRRVPFASCLHNRRHDRLQGSGEIIRLAAIRSFRKTNCVRNLMSCNYDTSYQSCIMTHEGKNGECRVTANAMHAHIVWHKCTMSDHSMVRDGNFFFFHLRIPSAMIRVFWVISVFLQSLET